MRILIKRKHQDCHGTGIRRDALGNPTIPCTCGDGYVEETEFDLSDLSDRLDDILEKCIDIKELLTTA